MALTYWYFLLQSLITGDLGQRFKVHLFLPNLFQPFHIANINHSQKSIKFSLFRYKYWLNRLSAIDLSYNLSRDIQYKHI